MLNSIPRLSTRPRVLRGHHNKGCDPVTTHHRVTHREARTSHRRPRLKLGDHQPTITNDPLTKLSVLRRIGPLQTSTHHRDRTPTSLQGAGVSRRINPRSESRDDGQPRLHQHPRHIGSDFKSRLIGLP